jgi:hypothetical protein
LSFEAKIPNDVSSDDLVSESNVSDYADSVKITAYLDGRPIKLNLRERLKSTNVLVIGGTTRNFSIEDASFSLADLMLCISTHKEYLNSCKF